MDLELEKAVAALKLDKVERHIYLCAQPTEAKCCDPAQGARSWDFLTRRLKGVGTEMALNVLAYNIKRMVALVGIKGLMAAIPG